MQSTVLCAVYLNSSITNFNSIAMNTLLRRSLQPIYQNTFKYSYRLFADSVINEKIDSIVKNNKVVVFMKGVPDAPRCGFSNAVVQIMRMHAVPYESHDVLSDENLRQGMKVVTYLIITKEHYLFHCILRIHVQMFCL